MVTVKVERGGIGLFEIGVLAVGGYLAYKYFFAGGAEAVEEVRKRYKYPAELVEKAVDPVSGPWGIGPILDFPTLESIIMGVPEVVSSIPEMVSSIPEVVGGIVENISKVPETLVEVLPVGEPFKEVLEEVKDKLKDPKGFMPGWSLPVLEPWW